MSLQTYRTHPSPHNVAKAKYRGAKARVKGARVEGKLKCYQHVELRMTVEELEQFLFLDWTNYLSIYNQWVESGKQRRFCPSIDRIDASGHYEIQNIQFVPWHLNARLAQLGKKQDAEWRANRRKGNLGQDRPYKITLEQRTEIKQLYEDGMTQQELSRKYGIVQASIHNHLKKAGVQLRKNHSRLLTQHNNHE